MGDVREVWLRQGAGGVDRIIAAPRDDGDVGVFIEGWDPCTFQCSPVAARQIARMLLAVADRAAGVIDASFAE